MHSASRDALAIVTKDLGAALLAPEVNNAVAVAAQIGTELFDVVEVLDGDRQLRIAVANPSATPEQRVGLISAVFANKVSPATLEILKTAATQTWSNPREFREGLVKVARRALLTSAKLQGQLDTVEHELFQLARLLEKNPELTLLLDDRSANSERKRELLAKVLYGKVTAVTEALALQVVGRREENIIDDLNNLSQQVAELEGKDVARVIAATPLSQSQMQTLEQKLERIYGRRMSIHSEVDPSLLGGMIIRVGDEVIDGSTSGKLERMKLAYA